MIILKMFLNNYRWNFVGISVGNKKKIKLPALYKKLPMKDLPTEHFRQ